MQHTVPPGPPPAMRTFFFTGAGCTSSPSISLPDQRIDGASSGAGCRTLCHTGEAPQAVHDIFGTVFHDFARQESDLREGLLPCKRRRFPDAMISSICAGSFRPPSRCDRNGTVPGSAQRRGGKSHQPHTLQMPGNLRLRYPDDTRGMRRLPGVPCTR